MRFQYWVWLLLAALAYRQVAQPATPSAPAASAEKITSILKSDAPDVNVGPNDPVIIVNGFCADPSQQDNACKTVITRAQFEKLVEALQPGMSQSLRLNVANSYARNLRMSAAAEKRGLDKTPAFAEEMRYARMQLLAQDLTRVLQAEANDVTDVELEDYYQKNQSSFEEATVARIYVPHAKLLPPPPQEQQGGISESQKKAAEEAMTNLAADLRARAAKGEEPDKLQLEAYKEAGIQRTTSNTKMEKVRRTTLPPRHESVLDLQPGEVSEVFSDPGGAHFIYKMISKANLTLEEIKTEIRTAISSQRYRDSTKGFQGDVVFSDAYFISPGKSATPPDRNPKGKRNTGSAHPDEDHN